MPEDRLLTAAKIVFALGLLLGAANFQGEMDPLLVLGGLLAAGVVSGALAAVRADARRAQSAVVLPLLGLAFSYAFC